jgi:copper transport protein
VAATAAERKTMTIALHHGARRHRLAALLAALAALVAVPTATAHSVLIATVPERDAVVEEPPSRVLIRFNEPVDASLGAALQVFDGSGSQVDAGSVLRPAAAEVAVEIEDDLAEGTYTVAWRVISADSDPIRGAFVFHVGAPGANPEGVAADVSRDSPLSLELLYSGGRFFEFAFLFLCVGGVAALMYPLGSAPERVRLRLYGILAVSAVALAVWSLFGLAVHGAKASGDGLGDAFTWSNASAVAGTRFGTVELIRAALALGLLGAALGLRRAGGRVRATASAGAVLLAAGLALTPTFAGHAGTAGALAIVSDIAHVLAASTWVGGLAFLVVALWLALEQRWPLATRAVPRFSTMAVASVVVLLIAGTVNGYLQVRTWRGLWETDYGLLLLAKIGLIVPLLGLGAFNNRYAVPRFRAGVAQPRERRRFMQAASVELVVMAAIVGVTAFLVDTNPARHALEADAAAASHGEAAGPMSAEVDFGVFRATVTVEPGTSGPNHIVMRVAKSEPEPPQLAAVTFEASLTEPKLGPLEFEATSAERGVWSFKDADFPIPGLWKLRIAARVGEFDLYVQTISIEIGGMKR